MYIVWKPEQIKRRKGGEKMYNHSELLGKMKAKGFTQQQLAAAISVNKATLNQKLQGKFFFTTKEIDDICRVLDIANSDISFYFFTQ